MAGGNGDMNNFETAPRYSIEINLGEQTLILSDRDEPRATFPVSTAANGPGQEMDSECTPLGRHIIDEKIGGGCIENTVFIGRQPTGEIYTEDLNSRHPERDWILTRIMWLRGTEPGRNDGGNVDSKARYIYIHGSPESCKIGVPGSRGCIRMRNDDVVRLFELVEAGTPVDIVN